MLEGREWCKDSLLYRISIELCAREKCICRATIYIFLTRFNKETRFFNIYETQLFLSMLFTRVEISILFFNVTRVLDRLKKKKKRRSLNLFIAIQVIVMTQWFVSNLKLGDCNDSMICYLQYCFVWFIFPTV